MPQYQSTVVSVKIARIFKRAYVLAGRSMPAVINTPGTVLNQHIQGLTSFRCVVYLSMHL